MTTKEFKVHFIYNSKGNRVELGYPEIQTLLFLNEHAFLSQPQLFEFYSFVQTINQASFRKKTSKWLEAGLIKKKTEPLQNGHSVVIISLAGAGLTVLKKLGYIHENSRTKTPGSSNIDHSLAIRQIALDVIYNHRIRTNAQIYLVKGLYVIGIQPNLFFNTLTEPVLIYKSKHLGEDYLSHFIKYDNPITDYKSTLLTSINPYRDKDEHTEVVADWLFKVEGQYLHVEVDCGNEQIRKSKNAYDTSFEGKLSRLQPQIEKKEIAASNYHVLFVMVDNRDGVALTLRQPTRVTRIANVKQEIARFTNYNEWDYEINIIRFSRAKEFLWNYLRKITEPANDEHHEITQLIDVFMQKKELHFEDWEFNFITKEKIIQNGTFPRDGYIPEKTLLYLHPIHSSIQLILPFFMEEGNVKKAEQLAALADAINSGQYGNRLTKILVIYPNESELFHDIPRKHQRQSNDRSAMDTSKMIFISKENFISNIDAPEFFDESKGCLPYDCIFQLAV
ncbi:hypothetical protein JFL43_20560 [Viridibacillus sp. YIM B01967]|uniref:Uncharacterized protein n=1 Tax=Viridibacillus soli TaxID=2798301 RepID=A0ABS1HCK0_9BACL|nr:hypothetical protein [Viridibacillus soli]MBK3497176.1 hypothetical protein [Viridibacillus soli]